MLEAEQRVAETESRRGTSRPSAIAVLVQLLVLGSGLVYLAEKTVEFQVMKARLSALTADRHIRLMERHPSSSSVFRPTAWNLQGTKNLAQTDYPLRIDENGFVEPSKIHAEPDVSVVFLGGSTTHCKFVQEEKRFPYLVGRILEDRTGNKVNSYNASLGGSHSLHSLNTLLNKVIPLAPDAVILHHATNDLGISLYYGGYYNDHPTLSNLVDLRGTFGRSKYNNVLHRVVPHLYERAWKISRRFAADEPDNFADVRGTKISFDAPSSLAAFKRNLQMFVDICRTSGITPVLMTQANTISDDPSPENLIGMRPLLDLGVGYEQFKEYLESFNQAVREVGQMNQVLVVDLERLIPKSHDYIYDTVHYNDAGSELAAGVISEQLREHLPFFKGQ